MNDTAPAPPPQPDADLAAQPNSIVRRVAIEHGLDPHALMERVREERRTRGLDLETGCNMDERQ